MKKLNKYLSLTPFEICLWVLSVTVTIVSYMLEPENGLLNFIASFIGVTAILFVAKGRLAGQILSAVFSLLYGYISFKCRYFGEMITYLGMSAPMAAASLISWLKNPYEEGKSEVKVARVTKKSTIILWLLAVVTTALFGYILYALDTPNLTFSIISITTSFVAAGYTILRSPYYALGYAAIDIILIVLWVMMSVSDPSLIPMVVCFVIFLINDTYGFINWRRMRKRQESK